MVYDTDALSSNAGSDKWYVMVTLRGPCAHGAAQSAEVIEASVSLLKAYTQPAWSTWYSRGVIVVLRVMSIRNAS